MRLCLSACAVCMCVCVCVRVESVYLFQRRQELCMCVCVCVCVMTGSRCVRSWMSVCVGPIPSLTSTLSHAQRGGAVLLCMGTAPTHTHSAGRCVYILTHTHTRTHTQQRSYAADRQTYKHILLVREQTQTDGQAVYVCVCVCVCVIRYGRRWCVCVGPRRARIPPPHRTRGTNYQHTRHYTRISCHAQTIIHHRSTGTYAACKRHKQDAYIQPCLCCLLLD